MWQVQRRIDNQILGVKGLKNWSHWIKMKLLASLECMTYFMLTVKDLPPPSYPVNKCKILTKMSESVTCAASSAICAKNRRMHTVKCYYSPVMTKILYTWLELYWLLISSNLSLGEANTMQMKNTVHGRQLMTYISFLSISNSAM